MRAPSGSWSRPMQSWLGRDRLWGWGLVIGEPSEHRLCCGTTMRLEAGLPFARGRSGVLAAYLGSAIFLLPRANAGDGAYAFGGPELGLDLAVPPSAPRHGPFPISYVRSVLGLVHLKLGLAWWFGSGLHGSSQPGITVGFATALGP